MTKILVIKTGALGDVLRTTSILPGLQSRFEDLEVTWLTAEAAVPLVERHRQVAHVVTCDPKDTASVDTARSEFSVQRWDWVLSLDDEEPLCALASSLEADRVSGALMDASGARTYTDDVEPWFGMGLLSRDGKEAADRRKRENARTHPQIFADMLGIPPGKPELPLPGEAIEGALALAAREDMTRDSLVIGLNTGAGGRWTSKGLPPDRVVGFAGAFATASGRDVTFLVLGGPPERARNGAILAGIGATAVPGIRVVDAGTDNDIATFAAIVGLCDLLVTSDSLALHLGVAMDVPTVAFFAPTSAAEIELYGLGEKVVSTAPDYCSYAKDADNSTITIERLVAASLGVLEQRSGQRRLIERPA
ncbi:MAG: glycosyltransferase family 9 protein [Planctomycetota bacterium]